MGVRPLRLNRGVRRTALDGRGRRSRMLLVRILAATTVIFAQLPNWPATALERGETPVHVTVCRINENPEMYQAKPLILSASVRSDGTHYTSLFDASCSQGMIITWFNWATLRKEPNGGALYRALYRKGSPGTIGKAIVGTFIGTLELPTTEYPRTRLKVDQVLEVHARQTSD